MENRILSKSTALIMALVMVLTVMLVPVAAYAKDGNNGLLKSTNVLSSGVTPPSTSITKLYSKKAGTYVVKWQVKNNCSGYQLQRARNKSFNKDKESLLLNSSDYGEVDGREVLQGVKYYFRIRTYKMSDGKKYYSKWSKVRSVVIKANKPKATYIKSLKSKNNDFTVTWKKQTKYTSGYQIQYAVNSKFTNGKKTKTVKGKNKTSIKISGLKSQKKYYVRMRVYREIEGKKYFSEWSDKKSIKTKKSVALCTPKAPKILTVDGYFSSGFGDIEIEYEPDEDSDCTQLQISRFEDFRKDYSTHLYTCKDISDYAVDGWVWRRDYSATTDSGIQWKYIVYNRAPEIEDHTVYYFRMRSVNIINGTNYYSKWSNVVADNSDSIIS